MRTLAVLSSALALSLSGCGSNPTYSVGARKLSVADQIFTTRPLARFCQGLSTSQVKIQLADYSPFCPLDQKPNNDPRDPTIEHTELDLLFSIDAMPDFRLNAFPVNPKVSCDLGGGPVLITFLHFPVGKTSPDSTVTADSGTVKVTHYEVGTKQPLEGTFNIKIGGSTVNGSFSALNCDM